MQQHSTHRLPFADILAHSHDDPDPSSSAVPLARKAGEDDQQNGRGLLLEFVAKTSMYCPPRQSPLPLSSKTTPECRHPARALPRARRSRLAFSLLLSVGAIFGLVCGTLPVGAILAPGDDPNPVIGTAEAIASALPTLPVAIPSGDAVQTDTGPSAHDAQEASGQVLEPVKVALPPRVANPPLSRTTIPIEVQGTTLLSSFSSYSQSLVAKASDPPQAVFQASAASSPSASHSPPVDVTIAASSSHASESTPTATSAGSIATTQQTAATPDIPLPPVPTAENVTPSPSAGAAGTQSATVPSSEPSLASTSPEVTATTEHITDPTSAVPPPSTTNDVPVVTEPVSPETASSTPALPNSRPAVGNPGPLLAQLKHRWNFASMDCAAVVHRTNPGAKFASSILSEKKDRYMLSPCPADGKGGGQFVIVELCDDIMIDTVVLGNYEFFSRQFKRFRLRAAAKLHAREEDWFDFGTFRARNSRGLQVFNVEPRDNEVEALAGAEAGVIPGYDGEDGSGDQPLPPPPSSKKDARFFRYVRIDFLEHYGSEFYCPVSVLRIYGLTALDEFYQDQEEGGDGGAAAAVAAVANPIVANVVELADQLDFAYQYAANGWGYMPYESKGPDESRLIGDGTKQAEGHVAGSGTQGRPALGAFDSHWENMLDAAVAAVKSSSSAFNSNTATFADTSGQWKKGPASSSQAAAAAAAASEAAVRSTEGVVETYRIDVDAGQPHVHVNIPGAGSALGADPIVLARDRLTCSPEDAPTCGTSETPSSSPVPGSSASKVASPAASEMPQPGSSIQAGVPSATSTQQTTRHHTPSSSAQSMAGPAQGNTEAQHVVPVSVSSEAAQSSHSNASAAANATRSTTVQAPAAGAKSTEDRDTTDTANASGPPAGQQPVPASSPVASGKSTNASAGTGTAIPSNTTATRPVASNASVTAGGASGESPRAPVPPPPSPSQGSGGGAGSESIYRAINKRLAALEYNSTLNLAFIEHSQRLLRDSFMRMADRHQTRIDDMVRALNASNWRQFDMLRRRTQVDLQRALFEADIRRQQADSERSAMMAQIHLLTEEVLMQKKISLAQLFLILGLFVFVALTRGMRAPQFIQTGFGNKVGMSSRPSTPVAISAAGSPNLDAPSTGPVSIFPTPAFIRQRLNRSRRVSAPAPRASSAAAGNASNPAQHNNQNGYHPGLAHQPTDRSRLSIVVPALSHPSNVYRLNSGASSPNGSILELNELLPHQHHHPQPIRGEHWRERIRSNGTGSIVSFLDEEFDEEDMEEEEGLSDTRRRSTSSVAFRPRRRSTSSTTTRSVRSASIRSGSDGKSMTGSVRSGNGRGGPTASSPSPPPPIQKDAVVMVSVSDESDMTAVIQHRADGEMIPAEQAANGSASVEVGNRDGSSDTGTKLKRRQSAAGPSPEKNKAGKRAGGFSFTFSSPASK
ncbi:unnamed protein product [Tilletia laevis]|uniref:SUN domain-containing protein n=2 Tax=Tilletia TaxID=13289 RepID=A0A177V5X2_9BASI|nr:hypothetical protein CF336_g6750 [Tilletia laevis]KAE8261490.1 hypothetical protein A4X03_0g3211 [Tilletia caries]KAE8196739.1 hypothetical protein CF335_g4783 [Tilletia laevis]CAD6889723.1 unnamed protein product [Tilletia caries]CAD6905828.1 unnamed protein product [Tilletia caries]